MDIEQLTKELSKYNWDNTNILLGIRANFKCEYCGKDLLESIDNYKLWQVDHIIPKYSGYNDCENFDNKAIACTQCNKDFKRTFIPKIINNKTRKEYIIEITEFINQKRKQQELDLKNMKEIINIYKNTNFL